MSLSFNLCLSVTSVFVCGYCFFINSVIFLVRSSVGIQNLLQGACHFCALRDATWQKWLLQQSQMPWCDTYPPEIWGSTWSFPFVLSSFMLNWSLLLCSLFISVHLFFCSTLGIWVADVTWCYYSAELFDSRYDPWAFNFYWFPRFTVSDAYDRIGRHALPSRHGFPGRNQAWLHSRGTQNFCEIKGNVIRLVEFALNFSKAFDNETLFVSYILYNHTACLSIVFLCCFSTLCVFCSVTCIWLCL